MRRLRRQVERGGECIRVGADRSQDDSAGRYGRGRCGSHQRSGRRAEELPTIQACLEALSRGMGRATFVDFSKTCADAIRSNAEQFGAAERAQRAAARPASGFIFLLGDHIC